MATKRGGWLGDYLEAETYEDHFLYGYEGDDTLLGNNGDDVLDGGTGADRMYGGRGNDRYVVDHVLDKVVESADDDFGSDTVDSRIDYTLPIGVEALRFFNDPDAIRGIGNSLHNSISGNNYNNYLDGVEGEDFIWGWGGDDEIHGGYHNDTIYGGDGNDWMYGERDDDTLYGDAGNDRLDGGIGADVMSGGQNDDIYYVENIGDQVIEYANQGNDRVYSTIASYTMTAHVEELVLDGTAAFDATGNAQNNLIAGNANSNNLSGGDGDDTLYGREGNDTLNGGSGGTDHLYGGLGNDTYIIRDSLDVVHESPGEGIDTVVATVSYTLGANVEHLTLAIGTYGTGNAYANTITGNAGANTLDGQGGGDLLIGGRGNDTYIVDNGGDTVVEALDEGFDAIVTSVSFELTDTSIEALHTSYAAGTTAINLTGNRFANTLVGNNGSNVINGRSGNDTLTGNGGQDYFKFNTAIGPGISNNDTITDFNVADDTIHLENAIFTALPTTGNLAFNLTDAQFRIGSAAQDADDRIIYNSQTGAVLYDADGNGSGTAVQFATMGTGLALTTADFLVI